MISILYYVLRRKNGQGKRWLFTKRENSLVLDYSCWHLRRTLSFPFYWTGCSEKFSLFASFLCLCWTSLSPLTTASQILQQILIMYLFTGLLGNFRIRRGKLGLYRTSRLVRKSGKFTKSGLSRNRMFSFALAGLL